MTAHKVHSVHSVHSVHTMKITGPQDPRLGPCDEGIAATCYLPKCGWLVATRATDREALDALKALLAECGYSWPVEWDVLYGKEKCDE